MFSGLKPNSSKSNIAGIGALKQIRLRLWYLKCINLNSEPFKMPGICYSNNKKRFWEKNKKSYPIKWKCFKNLGIKILDKWRLASDIQFFCNLKINATCFSNMYIKYNCWTAKSLKEKNVCCAKKCQYIS